MYSGSYEGTSYTMEGTMLVGSNPSKSVFHTEFDANGVPRIRSGRGEQQLDSGYWLTQMAKNTKGIYTSDGDPNKISFPKANAANLDSDYASKAAPYEPAGTSTGVVNPSASSTPSSASTVAPTSTTSP